MSTHQLTRDGFLETLRRFEGYANHMYLDSVGKVTIGCGIMLPTPFSARQKNIVFIRVRDRKLATDQELAKDFETVMAAPRNLPASSYRPYTRLIARENTLMNSFLLHVEQAEKDAQKFYPAFSKLPVNVQFALIDMSFNLGLNKLMAFKNLKAALEKGDWHTAANESQRRGPNAERNNAIRNWIRSAAEGVLQV